MRPSTKVKEFFEKEKCKEIPTTRFLLETPICNYSAAKIASIANSIKQKHQGPGARIREAYRFIRSDIKYGFDSWTRKASETLDSGYGMCLNKTNVLLGILRAMGIPSLYSVVWISREAFLYTVGKKMIHKVQPETIHVYGEAYNEDKKEWIVLIDTSVDFALRKVLDRMGHDPTKYIITTKPIERYGTPEDIIDVRRQYKKHLGAEDIITPSDMEWMNTRLEKLRKS